jgi:DNA modification methylase
VNFTTESNTKLVTNSSIEHADALDWLPRQEPGAAAAVIYDPPYSVGSPVRGREDGAAGSVFDPLNFLYDMLPLCARTLRPGGIVIMFTDWRRMCEMGRAATMRGLRSAACVAWMRNRPATGGLFRSSRDPVMVPRDCGRRRPARDPQRGGRLPGQALPPVPEAGGGVRAHPCPRLSAR